jgi:hypothetical protein
MNARRYVGAEAAGSALLSGASFIVSTRNRINVDMYPLIYRGRWVRHWPHYPEADIAMPENFPPT